MDAKQFIEDLDTQASADDVHCAVGELCDIRVRNKAEALRKLKSALDRSDDPEEALGTILGQVHHLALGDWLDNLIGLRLPKRDAIPVLVAFYMDEEVVWGWLEAAYEEDEGDHRSEAYAARVSAEMEYDPANRKSLHPFQQQALQAALRRLSPDEPQCIHLATGGGKTVVANDLVAEWLRRRGGPVLWVTKNWSLLRQACVDLARRHEVDVGRLGGDGECLHPLDDAEDADVQYTTLHTFGRRVPNGDVRRIGLDPLR